MFCMPKKKIYILLMFQNIIQIIKTSYSFNDSRWRGIELSCSKNTIGVIRRNKREFHEKKNEEIKIYIRF